MNSEICILGLLLFFFCFSLRKRLSRSKSCAFVVGILMRLSNRFLYLTKDLRLPL